MATLKYKKMYLLINIPMMVIFIILLFSPLFLFDKEIQIYYVGVIARITMGIWCIFNGIWNGCTDYYSLLKSNKVQKNSNRKWTWWLIVIVGIGFLITAFLGYGFNGVKKPI